MRKSITISILEIKNGKLYLAGRLFNLLSDELIQIEDEKGNVTKLDPCRAPALDTAADEKRKAREGYFYECFLSLHAGAVYRFICSRKGEHSVLPIRFGKFSRLSKIDGSFFIYDKLAICSSDNEIRVVKADFFTHRKLSRRFDTSLSDEAPDRVMELRREALSLKKSNKPIWLLSDRSDSAGDNGEAFFEYLMKDPEIGSVVDAGSYTHKVLYTAASMIISSSADEWMRNPLGKDRKYLRDLLDSRYIFLQHGVIKDDLSSWLHKVNKNLDIFITSSPAEWRSICDGNYGYDESTVKLTGLARYDKLVDSAEKTIAILPTWRKYAAPDIIDGSSERPYSESFKESEYFRFYNELINDKDLLEAMKSRGYKGMLYMHPNHMKQSVDFEGNDTISVWQGIVPFSRVFTESSLLVTDFSSVAIDFAYLGKPVVYTQFDKEKFFSTHSYIEGYYDYEKDGFGPVCYDRASAVESMIKLIESDCAEPDIFKERVEGFFAYHDTHNCRRIYEEVSKL